MQRYFVNATPADEVTLPSGNSPPLVKGNARRGWHNC